MVIFIGPAIVLLLIGLVIPAIRTFVLSLYNSDSTQFVSQLAQFQTMEQSLNQGEQITAIRNDLDQMVTAMKTPATSNSTTATK